MLAHRILLPLNSIDLLLGLQALELLIVFQLIELLLSLGGLGLLRLSRLRLRLLEAIQLLLCIARLLIALQGLYLFLALQRSYIEGIVTGSVKQ